MITKFKNKIYKLLRKSEKWTKTDMVYLTKGGSWLTLGNLFSSASGFLLAIAFANLVPKETYGSYKYILSIVGILSIPCLAGIGSALTQAVSRGYEGSIIPGVKTKIKWGLFGGLASLVLASYYFYNNNLTLSISFAIAGLFIPFKSAFLVSSSLFVGRKLFNIGTKYKIIKNVVPAFILIITLLITDNLYIILLSFFVSYTFINYIVFKIVIKKYKPNTKQDPKTINYGKHLSLMGVLLVVAGQLDKILLWHYLGPAQLAIYAFAKAAPEQIRSLFKPVIPLAHPKLAVGDTEEIKKTLPTKMIKLFIIIIFIVIAYIFLAPYLYKILFPQYLESVKYSQLFALVLLFFPKNLMQEVLAAKMQKKKLYIISVSSQSIKIISMIILTPIYGILGLIYAELIMFSCSTLLVIYFFKKM